MFPRLPRWEAVSPGGTGVSVNRHSDSNLCWSTAQTLKANPLKLRHLKEFHLKTQVVLLKGPFFKVLCWYSTYEAQCIV